MKNKKILIPILSAVTAVIIILIGYFSISYKINFDKFNKALESSDYTSALIYFKKGSTNNPLKDSFINSSEKSVSNKLKYIEDAYSSGKLKEDDAINQLNNLLSLDLETNEIENFKNTLPLIKSSKESYNIGVTKLNDGNPLEALNYFRSVSVLSNLKSDAVKKEETCLSEIRKPILETIDEYIANEKYSKGLEYLNEEMKTLPSDSVLEDKKEELEKLRIVHLENYSKEKIDMATSRTAPVSAYYNKLTPDTINEFDINSGSNHLVFVSIAEQKTYVYEGSENNWTLEKTFDCSTGIEGKETPVGVFSVQNRAPWFFSPKYGQGGKYYVQFMGNYLFHSIPFEADAETVSDPTLGEPASHGCIRLAVEDSKWMYDNVQNGSKIIIY
ncbi:L,D-transpeptidase [Clostridium sp. B9]|uniref:L,D-transpeptidase n=1 Tax=Clostridium sp. B9 TaxID=3423224 RepID=UPI003D2EF07A